MKNLLILIVAIAVFLHFNPQPELEGKFEEYKEKILATFSDATDTKIKLKTDKIYQDLSADFNRFSDKEIEQIKQLSANRTAVKDFYSEYCFAEKGHAVFHSANLKKVCETINKYQALL
ncbi:hypothetical protein [Thalassotalea sp. PLHSN55]|uniref:hypothetical protein n=1 Tax=Thalassotalea sp. PLHSN55 TaxID=3435888 RepID=UPI003F84B37C